MQAYPFNPSKIVSAPLQVHSITVNSCWYWGLEHIELYIHEMSRRASQQMPDIAAEVDRVKNEILLPCIERRETLVTKRNSLGKTQALKIDSHLFGVKVPIADVFTALGWFISVTDLSVNCCAVPDRIWNINCLTNYARLCAILCAEISNLPSVMALTRNRNPGPTMVHLLYPVDYRKPLIGPGAGDQFHGHIMSLSSSLTSKPYTEKEGLRHNRQNADKAFSKNVMPRLPDNGNMWGNCAETLSVLSIKNPTCHSYVYGAAMYVVNEFTTGDTPPNWNNPQTVQTFINKVAREPCQSCQEVFKVANITLMDFGKRQVRGPPPPDYRVDDQYWSHKPHPCALFNCTLSPSAVPCTAANYGCRMVWCTDMHRQLDEFHVQVCCGIRAGAAKMYQRPTPSRSASVLRHSNTLRGDHAFIPDHRPSYDHVGMHHQQFYQSAQAGPSFSASNNGGYYYR